MDTLSIFAILFCLYIAGVLGWQAYKGLKNKKIIYPGIPCLFNTGKIVEKNKNPVDYYFSLFLYISLVVVSIFAAVGFSALLW